MTILGFIIWLCLAIIFFIVAWVMKDTYNSYVPYFFAGALAIVFLIGMFWYYRSTESGKRALKSQESNFNQGIERKVEVYDVDGDLIKTYEGKFDVDYDSDRIIFDDEDGKRHVIYYPTGTVIIDEK